MLWAVSGVTFAAIVLVVLALAYAFSAGTLPITERLSRLWRPPAEAEGRFRDKQKERVQRMLSDVGKILPASPQQLSHTQRVMTRAGFRSPEAVTAMRGVKIFLPIGLLGLVYFTGFYRQNPLMILGGALLLGWAAPELWLTRKVRKRQHTIRLSMPDALDLLVICVEAGLGLDQALLRVGQELRIAHPELCEELDLVTAEIRVGKSRIEALRGLATRTGVDDIKGLVAMLIQTDRFGTSVAQSLRVHSDDLRTKRRQRAEEQAAKTTVKMVPPLVFFIFPALFVVILGPAVISVARNFLPIFQR
ncbi:MAG TPA: type II secretion system F family protein [Terriglobia bacterium]|nr:type II secretion system F family protein [Terriglobia bacterium]